METLQAKFIGHDELEESLKLIKGNLENLTIRVERDLPSVTMNGHATGTLSGVRGTWKAKEISEYKAITNMAQFAGGDRGKYKEWHENIVNAMTQVRPGIRDMIKDIETNLDKSYGKADYDVVMGNDPNWKEQY